MMSAPLPTPTCPVRRAGFAAAAALGLLLLVLGSVAAQAASAPRVDVVRVDGTITPPMARFVGNAITHAEEGGAAAVVLEVDTPGGLSSAMDDIIDDIVGSEVPVVVFVAPRGARAASAGVFIAYAAHVAAMAPGTRIGSASPVFLGEGASRTTRRWRARRPTTPSPRSRTWPSCAIATPSGPSGRCARRSTSRPRRRRNSR